MGCGSSVEFFDKQSFDHSGTLQNRKVDKNKNKLLVENGNTLMGDVTQRQYAKKNREEKLKEMDRRRSFAAKEISDRNFEERETLSLSSRLGSRTTSRATSRTGSPTVYRVQNTTPHSSSTGHRDDVGPAGLVKHLSDLNEVTNDSIDIKKKNKSQQFSSLTSENPNESLLGGDKVLISANGDRQSTFVANQDNAGDISTGNISEVESGNCKMDIRTSSHERKEPSGSDEGADKAKRRRLSKGKGVGKKSPIRVEVKSDDNENMNAANCNGNVKSGMEKTNGAKCDMDDYLDDSVKDSVVKGEKDDSVDDDIKVACVSDTVDTGVYVEEATAPKDGASESNDKVAEGSPSDSVVGGASGPQSGSVGHGVSSPQDGPDTCDVRREGGTRQNGVANSFGENSNGVNSVHPDLVECAEQTQPVATSDESALEQNVDEQGLAAGRAVLLGCAERTVGGAAAEGSENERKVDGMCFAGESNLAVENATSRDIDVREEVISNENGDIEKATSSNSVNSLLEDTIHGKTEGFYKERSIRSSNESNLNRELASDLDLTPRGSDIDIQVPVFPEFSNGLNFHKKVKVKR